MWPCASTMPRSRSRMACRSGKFRQPTQQIQSVPQRCDDLPLRKAETRQHIPHEYGSCWPYFGDGIQVFMLGLLQPDPYQSDECVRRGQFEEEYDAHDCKNFQHRHGQGNGAIESHGARYCYQNQRREVKLCGGLPHPLDDVPKLKSLV
jgi:hypothetical protein